MEQPKKKTNGKRNKVAGHSWELEIIKILKKRGLYDVEVVTCRANSRRLDAAGIDLMHLDEHNHGMMRDSIQAKTVVKAPPYPKLLANIRKANRPGPVIFHRQTSPSIGGRQMERDRFAITYMDRYLDLMACEKMVAWIREASGPVDADGEKTDAIWSAAVRRELGRLGL